VPFAIHLTVTVSQNPHQPALGRSDVAKAGPGTIGLIERLLGQLLRIGARASPPVSDSEQEAMILPNPFIEGLVTDLQDFLGKLQVVVVSPGVYSIDA
jgi:hypothetical protein